MIDISDERMGLDIAYWSALVSTQVWMANVFRDPEFSFILGFVWFGFAVLVMLARREAKRGGGG